MINVGETHDSKDDFVKRSEGPAITSKAIGIGCDATTSSENNTMEVGYLNKENHDGNRRRDGKISSSSTSSSPSSQKSTSSPLRTINHDATNRSIVERQLGRMDRFPQIGRRFADENVHPGSRIIVEDYSDQHDDDYHDYRSQQSLFDNFGSDDFDEFSMAFDRDKAGRMMPGVLAEGTAYTIKETIFQGYLEKKGSGFDWIGSRAWKRRWAVLVRARTDGHDVDVPLLQIYWDYHSASPSTVISLDSAVVLPETKLLDGSSGSSEPEKTTHPYRFKIQHVKKSVNPEIASEVQLTRILGCPDAEERDDWVYAINEALLRYEKEKAASARERRRRNNNNSWSPPRASSSSLLDNVVAVRPPPPSRPPVVGSMGTSSPPRIPH